MKHFEICSLLIGVSDGRVELMLYYLVDTAMSESSFIRAFIDNHSILDIVPSVTDNRNHSICA